MHRSQENLSVARHVVVTQRVEAYFPPGFVRRKFGKWQQWQLVFAQKDLQRQCNRLMATPDLDRFDIDGEISGSVSKL